MEDEIKIEGPLDINQALNEFQTKAQAEQVTKTVVANQAPEVSAMVRLVIKLSGGTLDEIQASYVLFGFALLIILISVFVFFSGGSTYSEKAISVMPAAGPGDPNFRP